MTSCKIDKRLQPLQAQPSPLSRPVRGTASGGPSRSRMDKEKKQPWERVEVPVQAQTWVEVNLRVCAAYLASHKLQEHLVIPLLSSVISFVLVSTTICNNQTLFSQPSAHASNGPQIVGSPMGIISFLVFSTLMGQGRGAVFDSKIIISLSWSVAVLVTNDFCFLIS